MPNSTILDFIYFQSIERGKRFFLLLNIQIIGFLFIKPNQIKTIPNKEIK
jgi:hypothetical protein